MSRGLAQQLQYCLNLKKMVDIMPGIVLGDISQGFDSTLGMDTEHVPFYYVQ
jgi:hypothetical protein